MFWHWMIWQINTVPSYIKERAGRFYVVEGLIVDSYTWDIVENCRR